MTPLDTSPAALRAMADRLEQIAAGFAAQGHLTAPRGELRCLCTYCREAADQRDAAALLRQLAEEREF